MDFGWSEEQHRYRETVLRFARTELADDGDGRGKLGEFSRARWQRCAGFGIQGLPVPAEYGGQGADVLTCMLAMDALGYGCRDAGLLFSLNAHIWAGAIPILRFGTEAQRRRYLPGMCEGTLIGGQGMSEAGAGSDAFSLTSRAVAHAGGYRLTGSKLFVTNAPIADVFVVYASTAPADRVLGLSAFIVERGVRGLTVGPPLATMGLGTSPMAELILDACEVGADALLGRAGNGMAIFNHAVDWERACILASAVGAMERQVETAVAHARERRQFGRPIGAFQAVSHRIVDMRVRMEAARLLLYKAGWTKARHEGDATPLESAMAKLFISEAWVQSSLDLLQTLGGAGYLRETGVERELRDAIASRIYSGTSDIQRNIIARSLGL